MSKKYYKVVSNQMSSARERGRLEVQYKVGEFVYPAVEHCKLFVFDNLKDAQEFAAYYESIYECEVINPTSSTRSMLGYMHWCCDSMLIEKVWKLIAHKKKYMYLINENHTMLNGTREVPKSTVFADAVKLVKKIC